MAAGAPGACGRRLGRGSDYDDVLPRCIRAWALPEVNSSGAFPVFRNRPIVLRRPRPAVAPDTSKVWSQPLLPKPPSPATDSGVDAHRRIGSQFSPQSSMLLRPRIAGET